MLLSDAIFAVQLCVTPPDHTKWPLMSHKHQGRPPQSQPLSAKRASQRPLQRLQGAEQSGQTPAAATMRTPLVQLGSNHRHCETPPPAGTAVVAVVRRHARRAALPGARESTPGGGGRRKKQHLMGMLRAWMCLPMSSWNLLLLPEVCPPPPLPPPVALCSCQCCVGLRFYRSL